MEGHSCFKPDVIYQSPMEYAYSLVNASGVWSVGFDIFSVSLMVTNIEFRTQYASPSGMPNERCANVEIEQL